MMLNCKRNIWVCWGCLATLLISYFFRSSESPRKQRPTQYDHFAKCHVSCCRFLPAIRLQLLKKTPCNLFAAP
ncbi:hypothetical protein Peur_036312 [Populus x canadensis]